MTLARLWVAPLAALAVVVAGCGGAKAPSVAQLPTTISATRTSSTSQPNRADLAACLTSHGFPAVVGSAATASNASISIAGVVVSGNADPNSPRFQAALRACRQYMPSGPPPLSPAQQAAALKAMRAFASCMRKHGAPNFPDPNSQGTFPIGSLSGIDPNSPLLLTAFKACESLEPKVGPRIEFSAGGVDERR